MKRVKHSLPRKALEKLLTCRTRPIIEYGNCIYDNCPKYHSNQLEELQMETARICTGTMRQTSADKILKVWSTVKIRGTRVPQNSIVPVGRPRPYSIIILNMRFIPEASLRAGCQITATSYILERHL